MAESEASSAGEAKLPDGSAVQEYLKSVAGVAFKDLTDGEHDAVFMRVYSKIPLDEVARILGVPVQVVKQHIARGVRKIVRNVFDSIPVPPHGY